MSELQVKPESLYQEAEKPVDSIRKLKQILERQKNIIKKMGGYWNGEGYEAATKNYTELSDKFLQLLNQLEDTPATLFDIAKAYEKMERVNQDTVSKLPDSILD